MKFNSKIFKFRKIKDKNLLKLLNVISILIFIFFITSFLNNGKIKSIIDNKDIISYLLIGSISQVINLHISNISKNIILPFIGIIMKRDLSKSIKINNVVININDLVSNLVESILNLLFIFAIFKKV